MSPGQHLAPLVIDDVRLERALQQRIYLLDRSAWFEFQVMGQSGCAYTVQLGAEQQRNDSRGARTQARAWRDTFPSCTCPDHSGRGVLCKHILFVLVRILRFTRSELSAGITNDMIARACGRRENDFSDQHRDRHRVDSERRGDSVEELLHVFDNLGIRDSDASELLQVPAGRASRIPCAARTLEPGEVIAHTHIRTHETRPA